MLYYVFNPLYPLPEREQIRAGGDHHHQVKNPLKTHKNPLKTHYVNP
jgi:hypothetical protein